MSNSSAGTWRFNFVYGLLVLALIGLAFRLGELIHTRTEQLSRMVVRQQHQQTRNPARPGNIFVASGKSCVLLAGSRPVPSVYADPNMIDDKDLGDVCIKVGGILGIDPIRLQEKFFLRRDNPTRFMWIGRAITTDQAKAIVAMRLPGIRIQHEYRRDYPNGPLASTVVGFPPVEDRDGKVTPGTGAGIELSQRPYLTARDGVIVSLTDAARRPIWPLPDECRQPQDGCNVLLTIDATIQSYLEEAVSDAYNKHEAKWATGIVVNPNTGEILAMCSYPSFNPNMFSKSNPNDRTNRAITLPYEPGSAAKPIFAAAAVDAGIGITFDTMFNCEGGTYNAPNGGRISDHGNAYGPLSVLDIVVHSSNIGMAKIGEKLGNSKLWEIAHRFGFGAKTGIELPGEDQGIVRYLKRWDGYSLRRVPFGQEISVTALQLAMAFSALVNGGELLTPRLVNRVTDDQGQVVWEGSRKVVRRVIKPAVSQGILEAMAQVVERGTGQACKKSRWTMFGKTGTAQIPGPRGYQEGAYTGTFVGGAPASKPQVLCLISVYWPNRRKGYYGGTVAAPGVKQVLEETLAYWNVPPDRTTEVASAE